MDPCIPASWPGFDVTLNYQGARYHIHVENLAGVQRGIIAATLDGAAIEVSELTVALRDDGGEHHLRITMG